MICKTSRPQLITLIQCNFILERPVKAHEYIHEYLKGFRFGKSGAVCVINNKIILLTKDELIKKISSGVLVYPEFEVHSFGFEYDREPVRSERRNTRYLKSWEV